jgi:hypothetical protein
MWQTIAAIVSSLVGIAGLLVGWQKAREDALRREDVLLWSNEVIRAMKTLVLICLHKEPHLDATTAKNKIVEVMFDTSILIERGRIFFKNEIIDDHGHDKEPAYRGYRPKILDPILVSHQIACRWARADEKERLRMGCVAEDSLKKFVSLAQREVGRSRTASAEASKGGDGLQLDALLCGVSDNKLRHLG